MDRQLEQLLRTYLDAVHAMRQGNFRFNLATDSGESAVSLLGQELVALSQWLDRRFEEIHQVQEISREISGGLFTHEVLDRVYDTFRTIIPYDRIGCAFVSDDESKVVASWARSDRPDKMRINRGYSAKLAGSSLKPLLTSGEPRIINDLEAYLASHPGSASTALIVAEGIRSSLTCPLIAEGRSIGFLFFSSHQKNTYHPSHQLLFTEIAHHLSMVIERSRFYQQIHDLNQQLLQTQQELERRALYDTLTGVLNRGAIMTFLNECWQRSQRRATPFSILMLDVDHFKQVNDNHGHLAGDSVLRTIPPILQSCLREYDSLGRFGGEEFLVVLGETKLQTASQIAERIRSTIAGHAFLHDGATLPITVSLGVACHEKDDQGDVNGLLALADRALYQAKHNGRNRVCLAGLGK